MITFAIPTKLTTDDQKNYLDRLIWSIMGQSVKIEYEILVCGNYEHESVRTIPFPEDLNGTSYIGRKQNLLLDEARYENVVFLRDYEILWNDWVDGFLYFEKNDTSWTVMMSPILNSDNTRYRDVCHWDLPGSGQGWMQYEPWCPYGRKTEGQPHLPPYSDIDSRYMYINGGYFICKKHFLNTVRWDDYLQWGQAEDVNISLKMRVKSNFRYVFNPYSIVQLQKYKDRILPVYPSDYFGSYEYIMSKYKRNNENCNV